MHSTLPYGIVTNGSVPFGSLIPGLGQQGFNAYGLFPQGRNITQYQFVDDYTLVKGRHTLKFGENFRRYDVSDRTNFYLNNRRSISVIRMTDCRTLRMVWRSASGARRSSASPVPIALWGIGAYAHDDWRVSPNLTITLGLRVEHNSNPVCQFNCFANFKTPFDSLTSSTSSDPGSVPYSADINSGQHQAYNGIDALNFAPSAGFSWSPSKDSKTMLSGGVGLFFDNAAAVSPMSSCRIRPML